MNEHVRSEYQYDGVSVCVENISEYSWNWNEGAEILFVLNGSVTAEVHKDPEYLINLELTQGQVYIFGFGEIHRVYSDTDNSTLRMFISKERVAEAIGPWDYLELDIPEITLSDQERFLLSELKSKILMLANDVTMGDSVPDMNQKVTDFIDFMVNNFEICTRKLIRTNAYEFRDQMLQAADYFRNYYAEKNVLTSLSNSLYMDSGYVSHIMKTKIDYNYRQLLNYYRVEHAIRMLLTTDYNISVISVECGFSATRYFYKEFKKFYPDGPTKFRKLYSIPFSQSVMLDAKEEIKKYVRLHEISISTRDDLNININGVSYSLFKANQDEEPQTVIEEDLTHDMDKWYIKDGNSLVGIMYLDWLKK